MASVSVGVGVTNPNPVRTLVPRATVRAQKTVDGLSYAVTKTDGTTVLVPTAWVEAMYDLAAIPAPMIDRPKGASSP